MTNLDWQPEDEIFDLTPTEDLFPCADDIDQDTCYCYNPDEEDRRKDYLENYAADEYQKFIEIYGRDELPY